MMKKLLMSLAVSGVVVVCAQASIVVSFGPSTSYVTSNVAFQGSGSGTGLDSYTTQRAFDTSTAWSTGSYTGPTFYGGFYQTLTSNTAFDQVANLGIVRNGGTADDYIRFQSMYATTANVTGFTQNFALAFATTAGSHAFGTGSSLSFKGQAAISPTGSSLRYLVVAGGQAYLSSTSVAPADQAQNTYILSNPEAINWAAWTPGATLDFDGLTYDVAGSSLADITFAGLAFNQSSSTLGVNASTYDVFSYTAVAVPEPSTYAALAGLLAFGLVLVRRRRA